MARRPWARGLPRRAWWMELGRRFSRAFGPGLPLAGRGRSRDLRWMRERRRTRGLESVAGAEHRWERRGPNAPRVRSAPWRSRARPRRRRSRWYALLRTVAVVSVVGGLLFALVDFRLRPTLHQIARAEARTLATDAIARAIASELAGDIRWEDLYALRPDSAGRVVLVQPNTAEIDRLTSKVTIRVQESLKGFSEARIRIPLGQVLGADILANVGPRVTISVLPIGTVTTRILSDFEQAGINQIRHKIYLEVTAHIKIVVPLVISTTDVTMQVPITEVLIMGDVPQTYIQLQGSELRDLLQGQAPATQ